MSERRRRVDVEQLAGELAKQLAPLVADLVVEQLTERGIVPGGKSAAGERTSSPWPEENTSMDPILTAEVGGSSTSPPTGLDLLSLLRTRAKPAAPSSKRARGSRGCR